MFGNLPKHILITVSLVLSVEQSVAQLVPILGGQRAGTAAAQFLKIGVGGRATAMGDAFIAVADDATALFWNPAGIVQFENNQLTLSHTDWLVDIKHEFIGYVHKLNSANSIGIQFTSLHMKDMPVTTEFQQRGTGEYFTFSDMLLGITFSSRLTDKFSFGATLKYFDETLDVLSMSGILVDLGTYYRIGIGSARFAVAVTNFGRQLTPSGSIKRDDGSLITDFQSFNPPTLFRIAYAQEVYENKNSKLTTSIQLSHPNDNSENLNIGLEYWWNEQIALRGGYKLNVDEENLSFGAGVKTSVSGYDVAIDYSYSNFSILGNVNRFSFNIGF